MYVDRAGTCESQPGNRVDISIACCRQVITPLLDLSLATDIDICCGIQFRCRNESLNFLAPSPRKPIICIPLHKDTRSAVGDICHCVFLWASITSAADKPFQILTRLNGNPTPRRASQLIVPRACPRLANFDSSWRAVS